MAESENQNRRFVGWIVFLAASVTILAVVSAMIHYAPAGYTATAIDEVGGVLPYALFAAVVTYLLIKPRKIEKPEVREAGKFILKTHAVAIFAALCALTGVLIFMLVFLPFPLLGGMESGVPDRPPIDVNLLDLPILNPAFVLTIVMMALLVGAVILSTLMRTKVETPEEIADEDTVEKGARGILGSMIDDEYRKAIIIKYVEGRAIMVTQGAALRESTTPREFEGNVIEVSKTAGTDFVPLTRLFEEARFSVHSVGEPQKSEAEEHYEKLRKKKTGSRIEKT